MKIKKMELELSHPISKLTLLLGTFLLAVSCSSDNSEPRNTTDLETDILGIWHLVDHTASRAVVETGKTVIENGRDYNYTIEFTDKPKFINTNGTYTIDIDETYDENETYSGENIVNSNQSQQEGFHVGEWRITNGVLVSRVFDITPDDPDSYELTSEIVELTVNRLVLKTDDSASSRENHTVIGNTILVYER